MSGPRGAAAQIARAGDLAALLAQGRRVADIATTAVSRLDADQLATPVHCVLRHDGEVVTDGPLPWGPGHRDPQAARHLPGHREQLADLAGRTRRRAARSGTATMPCR